jgi:hypothetical protein
MQVPAIKLHGNQFGVILAGTYGRTDRQMNERTDVTELTDVFRNYVNAPKDGIYPN